MITFIFRSVAVLVLGSAGIANAADKAPISKAPPPWNWSGGYAGLHIGAASGETEFSGPFGPGIFGDRVSTPGFFGGGQIGYNWQAPRSPWVFGIEADLSALDSVGTNTCLASSGFFVSANCRVRPDLSATLTGRIGYAAGPDGRTLLYVKGGLAAIRDSITIATNNVLPPQMTATTAWKWGGTMGAGIEQALTPAGSVKLEYDYLGFGRSSVPTPASFLQTAPPDPNSYVPTPINSAGVTQHLHQVKLGVNYRFGADPWPRLSAISAAKAPILKAPVPVAAAGWEIEVGARYWVSSGRFQKDLGADTTPANAIVLGSRLTYVSQAGSGEVFGRIDAPSNLFVKGFVGGGALTRGRLNDEDWAIFNLTVPYSNTISDVKGKIVYATIDAGYDVFRAPGQKLGVFAGYNFYKENKDGYGCVQIANPSSDCVPSLPNTVLAITENNTWQALRVGVNGQMILLPDLKLTGDIAYLPYVRYGGLDIHWLRGMANDQSPETGKGRGVQLEAIVSYDITPAFSVGVGGRYWAMWTDDSAYVNIFGTPCPCQTLPSKAERAGVFFQGAYRFDAL
jgi:opacity protein-like surface antigen